MKTTIHTYRFDIRKPEERTQYDELFKTLKATPGRGHWMESWGGGNLHYCPELNGVELELETKFLFENQWNADTPNGKGIRVFSRPEVLENWAKLNGVDLDTKRHLFVDAGQLVDVGDFAHRAFIHTQD